MPIAATQKKGHSYVHPWRKVEGAGEKKKGEVWLVAFSGVGRRALFFVVSPIKRDATSIVYICTTTNGQKGGGELCVVVIV